MAMNNKLLAVVAVIIVVAAAGIGAFFLLKDDDKKESSSAATDAVSVDVDSGTIAYNDDMKAAIEQIKNSEKNALDIVVADSVSTESSTQATIDKSIVSGLSEANASLVLTTKTGTVTLDKDTLAGLGDKDLTIDVGVITDTSEVETLLGSAYTESVSAIVTVDLATDAAVHELGGKATITIPYTLKDGESADNLNIWYKESEDVVVSYPATYADGKATFTVDHFSKFFIAFGERPNPFAEYADQCKTLKSAGLKVLGNVDGNNVIDSEDATLLENLVKYSLNGGDISKIKMADVNNDDKVDNTDLETLDSIINWAEGDEKVKVWHVNYHDTIQNEDSKTGDGFMDEEFVSTMFPVKKIIMTGSANSFMLCYLLGVGAGTSAEGATIVGATYGDSNDQAIFGDNYLDEDKVTKLGTTSTTIAFEDGKAGSAKLVLKDNVDAVLSDWNRTYLTNEVRYEKVNVDVIRVAAASMKEEVYTHSLSLLGFLFQKADRAQDVLDLYKECFDMLADYQAPAETKAVASSMDGYLSCNGSDYQDVAEAAGAKFGLEGYKFGTSTSVKTIENLNVWNTEEYHFDYIFHIRTAADYGGTLTDAKVKLYSDAFALWEYTQGERQYIISGAIPVPLRPLYAASVMNENLSKATVDAEHQKFVEAFFDGHKDIDLAKGMFLVDCSKYYQSTDSYVSLAKTAFTEESLKVFGNINADAVLDYADLDILDALIQSKKTATDYPIADVNQDKVLDKNDKIALNYIIMGCAGKGIEISVNYMSGEDVVKTKIVTKVADASLKVCGNINGDDKLDAEDLMLLKILAHNGVGYSVVTNANLNGDKAVDDADVAILEAFLNGEKAKMQYYNTTTKKNVAIEMQYVADAAIKGDLDGSGVVDDADAILAFSLVTVGAKASAFPNADVDGNGTIEISEYNVTITDSKGKSNAYPVATKVVIVSSNAAEMIQIIGAEKYVVGMCDGAFEDQLNKTLNSVSKVGTYKKAAAETIAATGAKYVISPASSMALDSGIQNELKDTYGIITLGLNCYGETIYSDAVNLATLFADPDCIAKANKYISDCEAVTAKVTAAVGTPDDSKEFLAFFTSQSKYYLDASEMAKKIEAIGGKNALVGMNIKGEKATSTTVAANAESVYAYDSEGNIDYILLRNKDGELFTDTYKTWINSLDPYYAEAVPNVVKNGGCYTLHTDICSGCRAFIGDVIIAKIFGIEVDLDPVKLMNDFNKKYGFNNQYEQDEDGNNVLYKHITVE
jgi:hypothetical protein